MSRWVYHFTDPLPDRVDARTLLGGKGLSLREMTQAGLRVPPGFTITTECCAAWYRDGRRWPEGLAEELDAHLERLEQDTGRRFGAGARPLLVSVRSGAARSMPGMMDTLLNCGLHPGLAEDVEDVDAFWRLYRQFVGAFAKTVHGLDPAPFEQADETGAEACLALYRRRTGQPFPTCPRDVLRACIDAVFGSWENDRAVAYRGRHDIRNLQGTAVNVQTMFPSQVSGIVFTRDPTAPQANRMVVEAAFGLGESVVSGDVTPDRYLLDRDDPARLDSTIGHKGAVVPALGERPPRDPAAPCLDADALQELRELCLRIETHFGHPVDVEFGLADGQFALLQARAIRGLDVAQAVEPARQAEIERLKNIASASPRRKVWVAHNLGETLPHPTPLTWDIVRGFMRGDGGFGRLYQRLGYRPSVEVRREGFLELICGRIYADPDRLADLFWEGMPLVYDPDALAANPALLDQAPVQFDPARADGWFLLRLLPTVAAMLKAKRIALRLQKTVAARYEQEVLPRWRLWVAEERARDLQSLDDAALPALLQTRVAHVLDEFAPESLLPGFFGGMAFASLSAQLEQLMGPDDGRALAATLTRALDGDTTFEQDALLSAVARGEAAFDEVLDRFGHRCLGEMELSRPRWREDPGYLQQTVERLAAPDSADPRQRHRENRARRDEAEAALPQTLAQCGGSCLQEEIMADLHAARRLLPYRESGKNDLMQGYALIRQVIEALAERWSLGGDIYFLRQAELQSFSSDRDALQATIAERRVQHAALQRLEPGPVIDSAELDRLGLPPTLEAGDEHRGTPVAAGRATGPARVVLDPRSAGELGANYVLVCPSTDPGWTPLFVNAAALIVERGGVLSHGAIVARDFGIPAVVLPQATRLLQTGAMVRVDGDSGTVRLLQEELVA